MALLVGYIGMIIIPLPYTKLLTHEAAYTSDALYSTPVFIRSITNSTVFKWLGYLECLC